LLDQAPEEDATLAEERAYADGRVGAMNGATHIAPMTAAELLSRSPVVAISVAATVIET
jgi:hypothetical protein